MLVGPGGVVALVVGAWSVLWAVRATPGRSWRAWYDAAAALVAALIDLPLLTAHGLVVVGFQGWVHAGPAQRPEIFEQAHALIYRPLAATALGISALVVALLVARARGPVPRGGPPVGALRAAASGAVLLLALGGLAALLALDQIFLVGVGTGTAEVAAWLAPVYLAGTGCTLASLGGAIVLGLLHARRRRAAVSSD